MRTLLVTIFIMAAAPAAIAHSGHEPHMHFAGLVIGLGGLAAACAGFALLALWRRRRATQRQKQS